MARLKVQDGKRHMCCTRCGLYGHGASGCPQRREVVIPLAENHGLPVTGLLEGVGPLPRRERKYAPIDLSHLKEVP